MKEEMLKLQQEINDYIANNNLDSDDKKPIFKACDNANHYVMSRPMTWEEKETR